MNRWLLLAALLSAIGSLLFADRGGRRRVTVVGASITAALVLAAWHWRDPRTPPAAADRGVRRSAIDPTPKVGTVPRIASDAGFAHSETCRECHQEQYQSWHGTYHRTMTQVATPTTVIPDISDRLVLTAQRRTSTIERRGDEFWVTMADPDWELQQRSRGVDLETISDPPAIERRIVMTTGSHHLQAYWIGGRDGGLRQVPWEYHLAEQRWLPVEDVFLRPPESGRMFSHWNSKCIQCHSVDGSPGWQAESQQFKTTVAELGIACESCHGAGADHVRGQRAGTDRPMTTILNPRRQTADVSARVCGQCHATFQPRDRAQFNLRGFQHRVGEPLEQSRELATFDHPARPAMEKQGMVVYWGDRACRVGGAEYLGLVETPCYQANQLSCLSCHSMHESDANQQLAEGMRGNQACLQCHSDFAARLEEHTHHSAESSGSLCYNCHMPHTSYALLTAMRSHRIDSPNIASSVQHGRPNACNLCHLDRTLAWSANHLMQWYNQPELPLSKDQQQIAASLLWLLQGDAMQRAITAWHLGWSPTHRAAGDDWQSRFLSLLFDDPYPAVRFLAYQSLRRLPGFADFDFDYLAPRDVRLAAGRQILEQLSDHPPPTSAPRAAAVLLDRTGKPLQSTIDRLRKQRDDRPVDIPE